MTWTLTVDSVDIINYVDIESILVEEVATQDVARIAVLRFTAHDHTETISIEAEDDVTLAEDGTTVYAGKVKEIDEWTVGHTEYWRVSCADQNVLLEETAIETYTIDANDDDDVEIAAIFSAYRDDIDASTYVAQLDATMPELVLDGHTLREALDAICAHTGGRYYVDFDKNLHYFADSESNSAAFSLSDSPDGSTSYGYEKFRKKISSSRLAKRFWVQGQDVSGWVTGGSYSAGDPEGVNRDNRITTTDGRDERGTQLLDRYESELITYDLFTRKDGLSAGMDVTVVNAPRSINAAFTIRRIVWRFEDLAGDRRLYHLYLNDEPPDSAVRAYTVEQRLTTLEQGVNQASETVYDTNAPSAPSFTAGNVTTGVIEDADGHQIVWIRATWGSVADDDLDHYEVQLADNTSFNWPNVGFIKAGETREYQWNGLQGGTDYYVRVRSVDWVGNYSAWSPSSPGYLTVTASTDSEAPAQVTGLAVAGARTLIGVTWDANSEADVAYYEVQRDDDSGGSPAGSWATVAKVKSTFYVDEDHTEADIQAGTTYHYKVRAVDTSGNTGDYSSSTSASLSAIGSDTIAAGAVIAAKIAASAVVAGKIAADAVDTDELVAGAVTATKIDVSTLSAITANMGTLTAGEIRVGSGTVGTDFTGFRIFSSYIAGYNSDAVQVYIDSSDGKMYAGGGNIKLDADGITIAGSGELNLEYSSTLKTSMWQQSANQFYLAMDSATCEFHILESTNGYPGTLFKNLFSVQHDKTFNYYPLILGPTTTLNAEQTYGLTIYQAAADDEALALKSSDVAHGATDITETNTYGSFLKSDPGAGGLQIRGHKDADAGAYGAMLVQGYLAENVDTTKSTAARGIVEIYGLQTSGTGLTDTVADGNVMVIRSRRSSSLVTLWLLDEDGDIYFDGSTTPYDSEDDLRLIREVVELATMTPAERRAHIASSTRRKRAEVLGIAQADEEAIMMSNKRHNALLRGALTQLDDRVRKIEEALTL
jgi:hypothetical protein